MVFEVVVVSTIPREVINLVNRDPLEHLSGGFVHQGSILHPVTQPFWVRSELRVLRNLRAISAVLLVLPFDSRIEVLPSQHRDLDEIADVLPAFGTHVVPDMPEVRDDEVW